MSEVTDVISATFMSGHRLGVRDGTEAVVGAMRTLLGHYAEAGSVPNVVVEGACAGILAHLAKMEQEQRDRPPDH